MDDDVADFRQVRAEKTVFCRKGGTHSDIVGAAAMPLYIVQAVERSVDGGKSVRVVNRWPYTADSREEAMAFVDRTPAYPGWGAAHTFEVLDEGSNLLASRPFEPGSEWTTPPQT